MKRLLATTTILALTTGFAVADVTLSGSARMGVIDDFGDDNTGFTSRARVEFTLSGETDAGLSFGASFRADNAAGANSGTAGSVFIAGAGWKISMGDVDGAANTAVGHVDGVGLTGLGDLNESMYIANGGGNGRFTDYLFFSSNPTTAAVQVTGDPTVLIEYSAGSFTAYGSATQPSYSYDDTFDVWDATAYALGAAYTAGGYKLSAGYEKFEESTTGFNGSADNLVLGADATFGSFTVKARVGQGGSEYAGSDYQDNDQWALSGTYSMDALAVTAFASRLEHSVAGTNLFTRDAIGLGASYDLGGGAKVIGGVVQQETTAGTDPSVDTTAFDLGLSFTF